MRRKYSVHLKLDLCMQLDLFGCPPRRFASSPRTVSRETQTRLGAHRDLTLDNYHPDE